jgi:DNA-binding phage protein
MSVLAVPFLVPQLSYSDSPLTSTDIYKAYDDIDMVRIAKKEGKITNDIADFLSSDTNSLDTKAAVVNALGWSINGTNNADLYCIYTYDRSLNNLNIKDLKPDELFCIGYMQALDDYFHPKKALPYLKAALEENDKSFTVAIILALTRAQSIMDGGDWCKMWAMTYKVLDNKYLVRDLRESAIKIIKDYMILYKC